jgi:Holliday junction resolvase RusA-like endonuclease
MGYKFVARMYEEGSAESWKGCIALAAREFIPASPLTIPLRVDLTFYFPRPKSHYRAGKHAHELRDDAPSWHCKKPDRDNSDKAVLDAMTVLRFWLDDCQVCDGRIKKQFDDGRGPGCVIRITEA